jgi:phosphatidylinositol glycan class N
MATLIGINWPVNSVGVLPDADPTIPGYLDSKNGDGALARAALVNAQVILEQYRVKHGMYLAFDICVFLTPFLFYYRT